ncbi:DUF1761 domain-containing protein [Lederbergia citrea]|uniref:DUF1761 domain-containing protein n=1 Tax=Lederbergia citrea TaxID=2833581 RepID=A0A942URV3_9BACI|nr:DUF1761 domain-containing protein [Lederbergia citrea]MBS4177854.1 DUF1761 domain-containing protein [Lederbergia citrea]MBS4204528.1 DUF1761 domain-containing protein [Lederbergia citrea]MBS4223628.1 DUF1761 domain-containing protein [Lederbergia citrea]
MDFSQVSIIAIILAVVANTVIGALWYSPILFASVWMKSLGKTEEELNKSNANIGYMLTMIAAIVSAIVLSLFISMLDHVTVGSGALIGFLAGLGIASARELSPTFFEGRKLTLFFISASYHVVSLTVMGMIIACFIK